MKWGSTVFKSCKFSISVCFVFQIILSCVIHAREDEVYIGVIGHVKVRLVIKVFRCLVFSLCGLYTYMAFVYH